MYFSAVLVADGSMFAYFYYTDTWAGRYRPVFYPMKTAAAERFASSPAGFSHSELQGCPVSTGYSGGIQDGTCTVS